MTKERRIAIGMWKYIRDQYSSERDEYEDGEDYICNLKEAYLHGYNGINWAFHCWFCQYIAKRSRPGYRYSIGGCQKCPLLDCGNGSYHELCNAETEQEWVEACNKIIQALGGSV